MDDDIDGGEGEPQVVRVRLAGDATVSGGTLFRLKSSFAGPPTNEGADSFIVDLARSPLIGEVTVAGTRFRLYGYSTGAGAPSFAAFLARFEGFVPPERTKYAYVVIYAVGDAPCRYYAIGFGAGARYLLREELIDIDAARDIVNFETTFAESGRTRDLRQIRSRRIGTNSVLVNRRPTRAESFSGMGGDPFSEVIETVHGAPRSREKYGSALSGGYGVTMRRSLMLEDLPLVAQNFESSLAEAAGHDDFGGGMSVVKDQTLVRRLDETLARFVREGSTEEEAAIAIPDFAQEAESPDLFISKIGRGFGPFADDLTLEKYREVLTASGKLAEVDVEYLKAAQFRLTTDEADRVFSVYRCLHAAVTEGDTTYVHVDAVWYAIPADMLSAINGRVESVPDAVNLLPSQPTRITEPAYNKLVGVGNFLLMDVRTVRPYIGETPIEVCDLLTVVGDDLVFVHVKRDFSSSTLSHLFEQGRVSATLLQEKRQREIVFEQARHLLKKRKKPDWSRRLERMLIDDFRASKVRVVYGIVGDWKGRRPVARLPFFSKMVLAQTIQALRGLDFGVSVARVQMPGA